MSSSKQEIVRGQAFNIKENETNPLFVLRVNIESIHRLMFLADDPNIEKVCFVGSSCMYPDKSSPLREEELGTGPVYPSNALYSHIKLLGWQICKATPKQFFVAIPGDIFGNPKDTHFIAQIMKKIHLAKVNNEPKVTFWGTGSAIRHPLFEDDFEKILSFMMDKYEGYKGKEPINIAPDRFEARSVSSIVNEIRDVVDYNGTLEWDGKYSDGQRVKVLYNSRLTALGFARFTPFRTAIEKMYQRFLDENKNNV